MWSHRLVADRLQEADGISASQIGRILADLDLKPHRVRGWLTRRADPAFYTKAAEVCDLYLHQPDGSVVICVDEKTAIAARSRKHPDQPCRPGRITRREFEYVRHGTVSIIAALEVHTGQVLTERISRNNSDTFIDFLTRLDQRVDPEQTIHLVLDNGSSHTSKATRKWLGAHPRFQPHYTPAHASWLDQAELFFSILTRRLLRRGEFTSQSGPRRPDRDVHHRLQPHRQTLPMDLRRPSPQGSLIPQVLTRSCTSNTAEAHTWPYAMAIPVDDGHVFSSPPAAVTTRRAKGRR